MAVTEAQSRMVVIGSWGEDRETGRCWQGAGASSCNVQESRGRCAACSPAHGRAELSRSSSPVVLPFLPDPCCQMLTFLLVKVDPFPGLYPRLPQWGASRHSFCGFINLAFFPQGLLLFSQLLYIVLNSTVWYLINSYFFFR